MTSNEIKHMLKLNNFNIIPLDEDSLMAYKGNYQCVIATDYQVYLYFGEKVSLDVFCQHLKKPANFVKQRSYTELANYAKQNYKDGMHHVIYKGELLRVDKHGDKVQVQLLSARKKDTE